MKVLIVAPHPDDEVIGCGGTISKLNKEGGEGYLCILTKGYAPEWTEEFLKNRPEEIKRANEILGIKKTYFLDFPTAKLDTVPQKELNDSILKVLKDLLPEIIYFPNPNDLSKDHRIAAEAVLLAARPGNLSSIKRIFTYETPSTKIFNPNFYENIEGEIETKTKAMEAYQSELKEFPHARSAESLKILAQKRGIECGLKFAEGFKLFREIKF